ncbi:crotonase/enoyl-CoA hydratase family protein [Ferrimonas gelatinilytica]|uniref:Crotonase/enoyl-CoA hydratase family protein n=1 Tax=Ferrimonas gelatinilytica TaxID=1255257 RepID=A0ABP9S9M4_9GAMM
MDERVSVRIEGGIGYVCLQRPEKRNALDLKMFKAIVAVQKRLARAPDLRGVILSGAGEDFCSGLDVRSVTQAPTQVLRLLWKWWPARANLAQRVCTGWRDLPVPVMAVLHGRCWGGGLQIALGADFRFATPDCDLSVMEGRWGLLPDMGGNLALREQLRQDQALWLAMSADSVDAEQAKAMGLVTDLAADPMALARSRMAQLMERSPDALAATKRLFRRHGVPGQGRVMAAESWSQLRLLLGRNQRIATARSQGKSREYQPKARW